MVGGGVVGTHKVMMMTTLNEIFSQKGWVPPPKRVLIKDFLQDGSRFSHFAGDQVRKY